MADDYKYITLLDTSTPGTYTVSVNEDTIAEVAVVGGGGGGVGCAHGGKWFYADGGGGAAFVGTINLPAGTYTVTVGAGGASNFNPSSASDAGSVTGGNSSLGDLIIAGGGIRGSGVNGAYPGAGGTLTVNADVISSTIQSNGNNAGGGGLSGHGQAQSLYEGYGKGGMGIYGGSVAGTNGYVKIRIRVLNTTPKFHPLMKREKAYWKTWHQPILTSDTSYGVLTASNYNGDSVMPYKIFDNDVNTQWQTSQGVTSATILWELPVTLKIYGITVRSRSGNRPNLTCAIYTDSTKTTPIGNQFTSNVAGSNNVVQGIPQEGIITNKIFFDCSSNSDYLGIDEVYITADYYDEHYTYKAYNIMQRFIKHTVGDYNPKNVLVIGSPTITEQGVVSGFSTSNYIRPTAFKPESNPWEMVWKITTGDDVSGSQCIFSVEDTSSIRAGVRVFVEDGRFYLLANTSSSNAWSVVAKGLYTVLPNTEYYVRVSWDGSIYKVDYKTEKSSPYSTDIYVNNSNPIYRISAENEDAIGVQMRGGVASNNFLGSIDLSESYMKVNDEYYWTGLYTENVIGYKAYSIIKRRKL